MQHTPGPSAPPGGLSQRFRLLMAKPRFILPGAVVLLAICIAVGVQPRSSDAGSVPEPSLKIGTGAAIPSPSASPSPTATASPATPTPFPAASPSPTTATPAGSATAKPSAEVAGVRSTPTPDDPSLAFQSTQCGTLQEASYNLSVQQILSGISVQATHASIYPIAYFRCILMATGGPEAVNLATTLSKSEKAGATHAVLLDLWVSNTSRDFGQVNLRTSQLAAAGQLFTPAATLGGRSEVVISTGQGRNVSLVVAITNTIGETTGPLTLTIDAPLWGGKPTPGKYQLFLPTP